MAADTPTTTALPMLKPEKRPAPRVFRGKDALQPLAEEIVVPEGAVMVLANGDWCDKEAALAALKLEGDRAFNKSLRGVFSEPSGGAGASARERSLRDFYKLLKRDDMKGISRKLYGHDKAKWFRLTDIAHPEVRITSPEGEPDRAEVEWDNEVE